MKQARTADHWRRLEKRPLKGHLMQLSGQAIPNMPANPVLVSGAITVITGLNGVGKSSLLHCACLVLRRDEEFCVELSTLRACEGNLKAHLFEKGETIELNTTILAGKVNGTPEKLETQLTWIDPAFEIPALVKEFRDEQNLNEALDQVGPIVATADELLEISWVVGKDYESCETFELDDFAGRPVTPYFRVKAGGTEYGTESMGLGEASLHYMLWNLKRMPKDSIVFIEEPETYVSARSQSALIDILAAICAEKNSSALVTTHSAQVFAKVPPKHTLILVKKGNVTNVIVKDSQAARLLALGVPPVEEKAGVLLVEDRLAREFTIAWLRRMGPELLRSWRVVDVASNGQVLVKLNNFPNLGGWFRAIGLLDGDEREKNHETKGAVAFLPGDVAPEILLREAIRENSEDIGGRLNIDPEVLNLAISTLDGKDHHDWFLDLAKNLGVSVINFESLVQTSFDVWIAVEKNRELAESSFALLVEKMSSATLI